VRLSEHPALLKWVLQWWLFFQSLENRLTVEIRAVGLVKPAETSERHTEVVHRIRMVFADSPVPWPILGHMLPEFDDFAIALSGLCRAARCETEREELTAVQKEIGRGRAVRIVAGHLQIDCPRLPIVLLGFVESFFLSAEPSQMLMAPCRL